VEAEMGSAGDAPCELSSAQPVQTELQQTCTVMLSFGMIGTSTVHMYISFPPTCLIWA